MSSAMPCFLKMPAFCARADRELQRILRQGERVPREQDDDCNQAHVRRVQHFLVSPRDNMVHIQPHKGRNVTGKPTWTSSFRKN
jgi:hypothetical protein